MDVLQQRVLKVITILSVKQQAFVDELGCSNSTFSRWLRGKLTMSKKQEAEIEKLVLKYEKII